MAKDLQLEGQIWRGVCSWRADLAKGLQLEGRFSMGFIAQILQLEGVFSKAAIVLQPVCHIQSQEDT